MPTPSPPDATDPDVAPTAEAQPAHAVRKAAVSSARRHHPVIATAVLSVAFAAAAGLQAWNNHRSHTLDRAVATAQAEREALLHYLAAYEHQIRGLLLPGSTDGQTGTMCRSALATLENSDTLTPADLDALHHALGTLDRTRAANPAPADIDDAVPPSIAAARRLGVELNGLIERLRPPLENRITELEARRTRESAYWGVGNLVVVSLLALGSMLFVWRLTRRLSAERGFAQRVIDASPVAILWKDREGRLRGYNDGFARFQGLSTLDEGLGKTARDLGLREEDARMFDAQEHYVMTQGESLLNVQEQIGPPGHQHWLSISRVPMHDARGRITGVLINFTEDSDRVNAEQRALEMSGRLAMGLNAAHGGEWEWNIQSDVMDLSDRWMTLFGLRRTRDSNTFAYFASRVHPDDMPAIQAALAEHFTGRSAEYRAEYRIRNGNGDYRWNLACGRVVEHAADGSPVRMQGMSLDIEDAKQNQLDLRTAAERADAANRAKSAFLATMSHELRTPLSGVIGMTELLRHTELDDRQRSLVSSCRFSSGLLLDLINGLLDFSKIEAGRLELDHEPFSPERCVRSAAAVMALHAHRAGLELDVEIGPGLPSMCRGDNGRLRQVLVNLLANAVKFTDAGRVRIELSAAGHEDAGAAGCGLSFAVTDTGIGIPVEKQQTLFEPFVQTDPSVTRRYGGTGLGLSISRSLVEAMGGRIDIDSAEGRGSTFTVTVPLEPAEPATTPADPDTLRGRVRLTDPDPASRPRLTQRLRTLGLEVVGPEATCDLRVTHVRADASSAPQPVGDTDPTPHLLLTPVTCPAPTPGAGPTRSLAKPFCDRELAAALRRLLNGEAAAEPRSVAGATAAVPLPDPALAESPDAEVLLVEDDLTNRQYLAELLRRRGVSCNVSTDGRDAVDRYVRRLGGLDGDRPRYRLVLMDYHLPEMDGWTATRAIRDAEAAAGAGPAVVIGVTAAGGADDRAAGTTAGVTGWLDKPVDPAALVAALGRYADSAAAATPPDPPNSLEQVNRSDPSDPLDPLDPEAALARCMGNAGFLSATLDSFVQTLPTQVDAFDAALAVGDAAAAGAAAHAMKGAAGLVTAFALRDLAARCEQLGGATQDDNLDEMRLQLDALRSETRRCVAHATRIRDELRS